MAAVTGDVRFRGDCGSRILGLSGPSLDPTRTFLHIWHHQNDVADRASIWGRWQIEAEIADIKRAPARRNRTSSYPR